MGHGVLLLSGKRATREELIWSSITSFGTLNHKAIGTIELSSEYLVDRQSITRAPTHPGVFFAEDILPALGRHTIVEIAALLGVSRQTLHRVMSGATAVSPDLAVRLGKLCGNGPELWLNMQARYDAWQARRRLGKKLARIPTLT
jgi:antitoxin HigA-1